MSDDQHNTHGSMNVAAIACLAVWSVLVGAILGVAVCRYSQW
jgi:hypothetical protein